MTYSVVMIMTDADLLSRIDNFLERTGMAPSRFGREAMREGQLIDSLRKGRSLSLANANRVLKFMADHEASLPDDADTAADPAASCGECALIAAQEARTHGPESAIDDDMREARA